MQNLIVMCPLTMRPQGNAWGNCTSVQELLLLEVDTG